MSPPAGKSSPPAQRVSRRAGRLAVHHSLLLFLLLVLLPARGSSFTRVAGSADVGQLLTELAREADVKVVLSQSVRGTVPVEMVDVDPLTALTFVCRIN